MNSADLQAAIDAATGADGTGIPVDLPVGQEIWLEDPDEDGVCITVPHRIWLRGNGCVLRVPHGKVGIDFTVGAQFSEVERLTMRGHDASVGIPPTNGAVGFDATAGVLFRNIRLMWLTEGLRIRSVDDTGAQVRNSNGVVVDRMFAQWCHKAVSMRGGDANQHAIRDAVISTCTYGVYDAGFLGGLLENVLFESCPLPGTGEGRCVTITEPANYSAFVMCYVEGDCDPTQDASQYTLRVGGTFAGQPGGEAVGCGYSRLQFRRGNVLVRIPSGDADGVLDWKHDAEQAAWVFKRYNAAGGFYTVAWANGNSVWPIYWTAERTNAAGEVDLDATGRVVIRT